MATRRTEVLYDFDDPMIHGRRSFISETGLQDLASDNDEHRDIMCIPLGCPTPTIFRKVEEHYTFIGDAYINRYMFGKAVNEVNNADRILRFTNSFSFSASMRIVIKLYRSSELPALKRQSVPRVTEHSSSGPGVICSYHEMRPSVHLSLPIETPPPNPDSNVIHR
jgi:hypothetical protein